MLQYMHYEKVQESFEGIGETDETDKNGEDENKEEPVPELSLVNKFLYIIGLYILFIIVFLIFGTIIFKYTMMTRLCKFGKDNITCLPKNLANRDEIANSDKYFLCDYFLYDVKETTESDNIESQNQTTGNETTGNETIKMGIPIHFSPKIYSLGFLYKNVYDRQYPLNPGIEFPYIKDSDDKKKMMETANTMFQNIWFPTLTYVFTCTNWWFSWIHSDVIMITSIILLMVSFIGISTSIKNNNFSWKSGLSLLYPFTFFLILIYLLPISIYYWSLNFFYEYRSDGTKSLFKWYSVFSDNELLNNILHVVLYFVLFWVWVFLIVIWMTLSSFSFFINILIIGVFITCIFLDESYYTWKKDNNEEDRKLNVQNTFLLFIFYCKTNQFVQFLVFITLGLIASGFDSTIGTIFCLTICVLFFYYFFLLSDKIKNMLLLTHLFKYKDGKFEGVEIKDLPKTDTKTETNGEMKEITSDDKVASENKVASDDKVASENKVTSDNLTNFGEMNDELTQIKTDIENDNLEKASKEINKFRKEMK